MSNEDPNHAKRVEMARQYPWPFLVGASANFIDDEAVLAAGESLNRTIIELESEVERLTEELDESRTSELRAQDACREVRRQLRAREQELGWPEDQQTKVIIPQGGEA